jgi:hypothetical protein
MLLIFRRILLFLTALWCQGLAANVLHVPDDYPTIQDALNHIVDGDTVLAAIRTYAEALMAPPLTFTLKGDVIPDTGEYPRPVIDPSSLDGAPSLACLILPAGANPVLEDLRFINGPQMFPRDPSWAIGGIDCAAADLTMRRCLVDSAFYGLWVGDVISAIHLVDCQFRGDTLNCAIGIRTAWDANSCYFSGQGGPLVIGSSHSRFVDCHFAENHSGNMLCVSGDGIEISDCVFGPAPTCPLECLVLSRFSGVVQNNVFSGLVFGTIIHASIEDSTSIQILGNTFSGNTHDGMWSSMTIYLAPQPGLNVQRDVIIRDNVFVDNDAGAMYKAIWATHAGALIEHNRFVHLRPLGQPTVANEMDGLPGDSLFLRDNFFEDVGVAAEGDSLMDARWNWWGDSSGPYHASRHPEGDGELIEGDLLFDPWYTDTLFFDRASDDPAYLPARFSLAAYPNPFNSIVTLTLTPSAVAIVRVELFDLLGRRIQEIWSGPLAFEKTIHFDGSHLASGVYFVRVWQSIGNRPLALTKLILLK